MPAAQTKASQSTHQEVARLKARVQELEDRQAFVDSWIQRAAELCEQAARGNLEVRLLNVDADGDLGRIIHSLNNLLDYTDAFVREARASLDAAAQGRFYRRVLLRGMLGSFRLASEAINHSAAAMQSDHAALRRADEARHAIADEFEASVKEIATAVADSAQEVHTIGGELASTASQTSSQADGALQASEKTSHAVTQVAHSTESLRSAVGQIDDQVRASTTVVSRAVSEANQANDIMSDLTQSSANIDSVVSTISAIAKQTHLLALNAAIEAAHAGDAGRGFAIVADEVRKLAQQASDATEGAKVEITQVQTSATVAADAIKRCGSTIAEVDSVSEIISQLIRQQTTSTIAINNHASQAAEETERVSENIGLTSQAAQNTRIATDGLLRSSSDLMELSDKLNSSVEHLLSTIRDSN